MTSADASTFSRPEGARGVNILIVDDEMRNLDVLESVLDIPGYRLVRATSADQALLALMEQEFALLILDIHMPEMSGIELANLIKQRRRTRDTPILFLTAYYQDEKYVLQGYGAGAVDYLMKPINPEVLRSKVSVFTDLYRKTVALLESNHSLEQEVAQRQAAEESLRRANAELEARVQARTAELTRLNDALRASEAHLQLVANHAPVYLAHIDREQKFKFVNRACAALLGRKREEILGQDLAQVVGARAYESLRPRLEEALRGSRVEYEAEIPLVEAGLRWLHIIYEPERAPEGGVTGLVAVFSDMTARKQAQQELEKARDDALAASRAKDDFLAALSHELRTPLNPVLLLASEALHNADLPDSVRSDFEIIRKNVETEARLIDDLLDITRIRHGKLPLAMNPVEVHTVLREALATIEPERLESRIGLKAIWAEGTPVILGDPVRLQQVFWNILKNAVKFTPEGGEIQVETRLSDAEVEVRIADTGIGMTEEELERIFQAFVQGEHAGAGGSHQYGGLGLGLAISRMLVESHQGMLRAESRGRGQGTLFAISFPLSRQEFAPHPLHEPERERQAQTFRQEGFRGRILVVEDHESTRNAIMQLLIRRRFEVVEAGSVAEARKKVKGGEYDLVISDIGLPDGNGYDLMGELARNYGLKGIALTGYGMDQDVARSRSAGFLMHLTKPVHVRTLDQALETAFSG